MLRVGATGEGLSRRDRIAAIGSDQTVRHGAETAIAPPRCLRVRRDTNRARDVRGIAVTCLHAVVVVTRGEVHDRLWRGGLNDFAHIGRDQTAARKAAEVDRLEVTEEGVVALDRHHALPRLDLVAVIERMDLEVLPTRLPSTVVAHQASTLAQRRDCLVNATEHRGEALEDLHHDARPVVVSLQHLLRVIEIRVGVVARTNLVDRKVEHFRRQAGLCGAGQDVHLWRGSYKGLKIRHDPHTAGVALVTYLPSSDYAEMPWRNGAGTTHEIAIDDSSGESKAPFLWRLSMADLAGDGPFSEIADVDRILVLLEGEDVLLTIAGAAPEPLAEHEAIAFPGDVTTSLTMAPGSGRDLNLMWDRTRVQGMVDILNIGDTLQIEEHIAFAIALGTSATIEVDGDEHVLGEQDALQLDDATTFAVLDGEVYVARID